MKHEDSFRAQVSLGGNNGLLGVFISLLLDLGQIHSSKLESFN